MNGLDLQDWQPNKGKFGKYEHEGICTGCNTLLLDVYPPDQLTQTECQELSADLCFIDETSVEEKWTTDNSFCVSLSQEGQLWKLWGE